MQSKGMAKLFYNYRLRLRIDKSRVLVVTVSEDTEVVKLSTKDNTTKEKAMKALRFLAATLFVLPLLASTAFAETDTVQASISAPIPSRVEMALEKDDGSTSIGTADSIVFTVMDDQDGQPDGSPGFLYTPPRSEEGSNYHVLNILSTASTMTLSADVTGTAGPKSMSEVLYLFFGGLFHREFGDQGAKSGDWEEANSFTRTLNKPFAGVAPINYRLTAWEVPAGNHTGAITFTLTGN